MGFINILPLTGQEHHRETQSGLEYGLLLGLGECNPVFDHVEANSRDLIPMLVFGSIMDATRTGSMRLFVRYKR